LKISALKELGEALIIASYEKNRYNWVSLIVTIDLLRKLLSMAYLGYGSL